MNFPCPLCGRIKEVRINRRSKPFLRCDDCGLLLFVNRRSGIDIMTRGEPARRKRVGEAESLASLFD